jgi:hypothetical protein
VLDLNAAQLLVRDVGALAQTVAGTLGTILGGSADDATAAGRTAEEKLTKLLGEDNLVGSSGEFGLLFAFLINKPAGATSTVSQALSLEDVQGHVPEHDPPTGWQTWKKRRVDWTVHTTGLLLTAAKEYHAQKRSAS